MLVFGIFLGVAGRCSCLCTMSTLCSSSLLACRAPTLTYSMHGGAGALISIGMLKAVDFDEMEDCVLREWSTGKRLQPSKAGLSNVRRSIQSHKKLRYWRFILSASFWTCWHILYDWLTMCSMTKIALTAAAFHVTGGDSFITICLWKVRSVPCRLGRAFEGQHCAPMLPLHHFPEHADGHESTFWKTHEQQVGVLPHHPWRSS